MTPSPRPRAARASAALTAATLVAAVGLAAAPGASATDPVQYRATTASGIVDLVLTLPAPVPGVPNPVELTLLGTEGQARHAAADADVSQARSFLAGGSLVTGSPLSAALAPLSRTLEASLTTPGPLEATAVTVPSNPLGLAVGIGAQRVSVTPASGANAASGQLADVQLGSLRSLGLGALLDPVTQGLDAAVATLVTQAAPLTSGLSQVPALPSVPVPNPLQPVVGGPATIPTPTVGGAAVAAAVNELPARIAALEKLLVDGNVLALNGLDTGQTITPTAVQVAATSRARLAKASLFGGLITVNATAATATATAALTRSDAAGDASATLVDVKVADTFGELLNLVASDKGITAGLLGGTLGTTLDPTLRPTVQAVDTALAAVLKQLTDLLKALGGGAQLIRQGTTSRTVSADGRTAEAHASPALVTIGLPVAPNLVTLSIGSADATAAVLPAVVQAAAPAPAAAPPAAAPVSLPRTGADTGAAVLALLLTAGGLLVWRRRTA